MAVNDVWQLAADGPDVTPLPVMAQSGCWRSGRACPLCPGISDSGYDRQALHDDYRLSALWLITRPIGQAANNIAARVWWNNLERIMLAVDDLGCRDLLS